jgi:hypothetical protein
MGGIRQLGLVNIAQTSLLELAVYFPPQRDSNPEFPIIDPGGLRVFLAR